MTLTPAEREALADVLEAALDAQRDRVRAITQHPAPRVEVVHRERERLLVLSGLADRLRSEPCGR